MPARTDADARRPLIVRLCNWVGEVVLAVPTLRRLEAAGCDLTLVGRGWSRALLEGCGWRVAARPPRLLAAAGQLRELRREAEARYRGRLRRPAALLLTKSFSSALEARLAGLSAHGYARDGRSWLLAGAYPLPRFAHASHAYWHLASRFLGADAPYPDIVDLAPSAAQQAAATALLSARRLAPGGYVLLCPFSGADDRERRKVWPGFADLARRLGERGVPIVVCPGPGEDAAAEALLPEAERITGTDLGSYAALLAAARCVVANDTGPGHLAAAVGARLISIYGPQSVAAWAPLGRRVELLLDARSWPEAGAIAARILA